MDTLTPAQRSERMSRIRSSGTDPEIRLATELKKSRFKYTTNDSSLPGKHDFVFLKHKVVVFVHGCFGIDIYAKRKEYPSLTATFGVRRSCAIGNAILE